LIGKLSVHFWAYVSGSTGFQKPCQRNQQIGQLEHSKSHTLTRTLKSNINKVLFFAQLITYISFNSLRWTSPAINVVMAYFQGLSKYSKHTGTFDVRSEEELSDIQTGKQGGKHTHRIRTNRQLDRNYLRKTKRETNRQIDRYTPHVKLKSNLAFLVERRYIQ